MMRRARLWQFGFGAAISWAVMLAPAAGGAQGKAPAPEFSVEMNFQVTMARQLAERCAALDFDHAGYDRHIRALIAKFSDRGIPAREQSKHFAPIQLERYERYYVAFVEKHALERDGLDQAFCDAGVAEAEWRTPIGRMLKVLEQ